VQVELDDDGYPTEKFLQEIRDYKDSDPIPLLEAIIEAWTYDTASSPRPGIYSFATMGWSGNESLLDALQSSVISFVLHWDSISAPGGLYCVAITKEAKEEMEKLHMSIVEWAWRKNDT
jgi:hypothetical protein